MTRWKSWGIMANKWMVLVGTFLVMFWEVGTLKSFSVLLEHIIYDLNMTASQLGTYIGLSHGITITSGILSNALLRKIAPRRLVMIGGIVGAMALIVCFWVNSHIQLAICLILSGCGYGMVVLPSHVSVISEFSPSYSIALSIGLTGGGFGMMFLPLLTEFFLTSYGWRGAILLLGALSFNVVAAGAVFQSTLIRRKSDIGNDAADVEKIPLNKALETSKQVQLCSLKNCYIGTKKVIGLVCRISDIAQACLRTTGIHIFVAYVVLNFCLIATLTHGITYTGWTVFVVPNALTKGIEERNAVMLSFAAGIGNIVGRGSPGLLQKVFGKTLTSRVMFIFFSVTNSMPLFLNTFAGSYPVLVVFAVVNGMSVGAKTVLKTMIFVDVVPESCVSTAVAFAMMSQGIGEFIGGWLTGCIYDKTGSFDTANIALGAVELFGATVIVLSFLHEKLTETELMEKNTKYMTK